MLLITHAITGVALASIQKSIPAGFFIGLISHYLLDMIPHYDHFDHEVEPSKRESDKLVIKKALPWITLDGLVAITLPLLLFWPTSLEQFFITSAAIVASILPDFLQGPALIFPKNKIITAHYRFHNCIHTKIRINHIPHIAIPLQIGFNLVFIWFANFAA